MKNFRKPYLSMLIAIIVLFVSCEQYDTPEVESINKFDYSAFNKFKNSNIFDVVIEKVKKRELQKKANSIIERNTNALNIINSELGTNLKMPNLALQLTTTINSPNEILDLGLENGWIKKGSFDLTKSFINQLSTEGFEIAILNYEKETLKLSLESEEFAKMNIFANTMRSMNYKFPDAFKINRLSKSNSWGCFFASVALVATAAGLTSCVTVVACGLAVTLHVMSIANVYDKCIKPALE